MCFYKRSRICRFSIFVATIVVRSSNFWWPPIPTSQPVLSAEARIYRSFCQPRLPCPVRSNRAYPDPEIPPAAAHPLARPPAPDPAVAVEKHFNTSILHKPKLTVSNFKNDDIQHVFQLIIHGLLQHIYLSGHVAQGFNPAKANSDTASCAGMTPNTSRWLN